VNHCGQKPRLPNAARRVRAGVQEFQNDAW
jgi:hypothetical protein